ncbi:metalloendoproteinase 3-MMP-like [Momordica charantia]|uniref:Metalloendoproteinase 3-MMP-like n=1 Tax=Momordica charantia TaxID=3673 RepID=A0A6J1C1I2_MOMCH|nr:metalloendoproteinase 3-MMP-like [Momordica charantia]
MASSKALQLQAMVSALALVLVLISLFPHSEGCIAADESNNYGRIKFHRVSHYSFFPGAPRWPPSKYSLTYNFPSGFPQDKVGAVVAAFNEWDSKTKFSFTRVANNVRADITISFQRGNHGDGYPFDGPGGVLAHAFAPTDGRLHLDGDDRYAVGAVPGNFDTSSVVVHEIGHIMGLGHSNDPQAIMYPYINDGVVKATLQQDDLNGIRALYGP